MSPDIFDRATEAEEAHREAAIAQARAARASGRDSLVDCAECGDPIPEARRLAVPGCQYCIACQKLHEATQRRGRAIHP